MNNQSKLFNGYRNGMITLLVMSVIIVSVIFINYGNTVDKYLEKNNIETKIYQLKTHYDFFRFDSAFPPLKEIPLIVLKLGYYSIILIYSLFFLWLLFHAFSTYSKLFYNKGAKFLMVLETLFILFIFILIINPGLNIWLSVVTFLCIAFVLIMTLMYWYAIKYKK